MRYLNLATVLLLGMTSVSALAQAPGLDPGTGARPGHEPGIGELTAAVQQREQYRAGRYAIGLRAHPAPVFGRRKCNRA